MLIYISTTNKLRFLYLLSSFSTFFLFVGCTNHKGPDPDLTDTTPQNAEEVLNRIYLENLDHFSINTCECIVDPKSNFDRTLEKPSVYFEVLFNELIKLQGIPNLRIGFCASDNEVTLFENASMWCKEGRVCDCNNRDCLECYLVYNKSKLNEFIDLGVSDFAVMSIFAHELAHFLYRHDPDASNAVKMKNEIEADKFAGYVMGKIKADLKDAQAYVDFFEEENSEIYPSKEDRKKYIAEAFNQVDSNDTHFRSQIPTLFEGLAIWNKLENEISVARNEVSDEVFPFLLLLVDKETDSPFNKVFEDLAFHLDDNPFSSDPSTSSFLEDIKYFQIEEAMSLATELSNLFLPLYAPSNQSRTWDFQIKLFGDENTIYIANSDIIISDPDTGNEKNAGTIKSTLEQTEYPVLITINGKRYGLDRNGFLWTFMQPREKIFEGLIFNVQLQANES